MDVTKAPITSKTILIEFQLEVVQNSIWVFKVQNNCVYSILCMHSMQTYMEFSIMLDNFEREIFDK